MNTNTIALALDALRFYANPGDYKAPFTGGMGVLYFDCGEKARAAIAALEAELQGWRPISEAPRGSGEDGPELTTDPDYVKPPRLLLLTADGVTIGNYEWYYHEGYGHGAEPGVSAWRNEADEPIQPTHYLPLSALPAAPPKD